MSTSSSSRRGPPRAFLALLASALCSLAAGAQESPLVVRLAGPQPLQASGRTPLSFAVFVLNQTSVERTFRLDTALPGDWRTLAATEPFAIAPGDSAVRIVAVLVPSLARAGSYVIGCTVTDEADPALAAACDVQVEIAPDPSLRLEVASARDFVIAGTAYEVSFRMVNTGNVDLRFALEISGGDYPCDLSGVDDPGTIELPAGVSREVTVTVHTSSGLKHAVDNSVSLVIRPPPSGAGDRSRLPGPLTSMTMTEVIPPASTGSSIMHTLPVATETTAILEGDGGVRGLLVETISTNGTLDEAGRHRLELKARKVLATDEDLLFNPEDRYAIAYRYGFAELLLLDQGFSISPLLAFNETGRGLQVSVSPGPLCISGLYYRDVWAPGQPQGLGGRLGYAITGSESTDQPLYRVDLGVFSHLAGATGFDLWQRFEPAAWLGVQLDTALQISAVDGLVPALLLDAEGTLAGWSYQARYLRAWPDFDGPYRDTQYIGTGAGVRLLDGRLALHGSGALSESNLLREPSLLVAPRTFQMVFGANGKVPAWRADGALSWTSFRRTDLLLAPGNGSWEHIARFSWKQEFDPVTLGIGADFAGWIDLDGGTSYLDQTDTVSVDWQRTSRDRYGVSAAYAGRWSRTAIDRHEQSLGASAAFTWPRTNLDLSAKAGLVFSELGWLGASVRGDAAFKHRFAWGHMLSASAGASYRIEGGVPSTGYNLSLSYGATLDVPVCRKSDTAIVRGTVIRGESGVPVQGAILRLNGLAAVSGSRGEFKFYLSKTGTHYLQVDRGSLARGLIPVQPLPIAIESKPGSDISVHIVLVEGGAVTGNVAVYGFGDEVLAFRASSEEAEPARHRIGGLANVVVELSGHGEPQRRVTGADGRFRFEEVVPGSYSIAVVGGTIPSYHTIEHSSQQVTVTAGKPEEVEFRVLQDRRTVRILESDTTLVAEEAPRLPGELTLSLKSTEPPAAPASETVPSPVPGSNEVAVIETPPAVPVEATPIETTPVAPEQPLTPEQPVAPAQPAPEVPVELPAAPKTLPFRTVPPAAPAEFDDLGPTWEEIVEAWRSLPFAQAQLPAPEFTVPADVAPTVAAASTVPAAAPAVAPAAVVPASAVPVVPAPTAPAPTTPAAPGPASGPVIKPPVTAPTVPAPVPTPPPIVVPIPLPMPTPRPPVTVPVPSPTPRPFPP